MLYEPLVTIIIPVYNGSNFLEEAINSALSQTYSNLEILVINDGSNDNDLSEKIALSYGNKITYYKKENGGVSTALNYALKRMHGEWFSWLSHDDLYYPEKIEKQIAFINQLMDDNPNLDINKIVIHTATESIDKDGKVIKRPSYSDISVKEDTLDVIIGSVYNYRLSGCSFLLPKYCYQDLGGFREDIRTVSDVEYWYRLLFAGYQFYCMKNDVLVKNRSHGKQVGKVKESLFEKELNTLHIDIAKKLYADEKYKSKVITEKFYLGLVKREMKIAEQFVFNNEIKQLMSPLYINTLLRIKSMRWRVQGKARECAKWIYRKVYVR